MIGYFDPDSLKVDEAEGVISFVNASDANDIHPVRITSASTARTVAAALRDQLTHGLAGFEGRFRKVQGTFRRTPNRHDEGIITQEGTPVPARMGFDVKPGDLPERGICIAVGEMLDGALSVSRMTLEPIAPLPRPATVANTPDS